MSMTAVSSCSISPRERRRAASVVRGEPRQAIGQLLQPLRDDELAVIASGLTTLQRAFQQAGEQGTEERHGRRTVMLTRLLRERLRPYTAQVAVVVTLLVIQTVGNLYLPTLNADIIDNGVVKGDTSYILHDRGADARGALVGADRLQHHRRLFR